LDTKNIENLPLDPACPKHLSDRSWAVLPYMITIKYKIMGFEPKKSNSNAHCCVLGSPSLPFAITWWVGIPNAFVDVQPVWSGRPASMVGNYVL